MKCPNCGKEALDINGRQICLDCGIEVAHGAPTEPKTENSEPVQAPGEKPAQEQPQIPETYDRTSMDSSKSKAPSISDVEPIPDLGPKPEVGVTEEKQEDKVADIIQDLQGGVSEEKPGREKVTEDLGTKEVETPTAQSEPVELEESENIETEMPSTEQSFETAEDGEKVGITVAKKKEEAPNLDLTNARSEELENVEAKPVSEIVPKEPDLNLNQNTTVENDKPPVPNVQGPEVYVNQNQTATPVATTPETPKQQPQAQMPVDSISFGNVESSAAPSSEPVPINYQGVKANTGMDVMPASGMARSGSIGKIIIIILLIVFVLALMVLGYLYWDSFISIFEEGPVNVIE